MKVICLGDIYGSEGSNAVLEYVRRVRSEYDLVIVNGENAAGGFGIYPKGAEELFNAGVDVITTGNHVWNKRELIEHIKHEPRILRPYNFADTVPGNGYIKLEIKGEEVYVLNMQGYVFMPPINSPFQAADKFFSEPRKNVIVDFHAEATAEKIAFGRFLEGRAALVYGTHTHVQTNDAQIFSGGTGFCTDIGMCGSHNGVIGVEREIIIKKFLDNMPSRFTPASGNCYIHGIAATLANGKCVEIELIKEKI